MSDITTLQTASDVLAISETAESSRVEAALAAVINQARDCGQTSAIFSTKLTDAQVQMLKDKKYEVKVAGVNTSVTPQYIISWDPNTEGEDKQ